MLPCAAVGACVGIEGESGLFISHAGADEVVGPIFSVCDIHHQGIGVELGGPVGVLPGVVATVDRVGALDATLGVAVLAFQILGAFDELEDSAGCLAILVVAR